MFNCVILPRHIYATIILFVWPRFRTVMAMMMMLMVLSGALLGDDVRDGPVVGILLVNARNTLASRVQSSSTLARTLVVRILL